MTAARPVAGGLTVAALLAACGYTVGYQEPGRGIAVRVADNRTFRQRIEIPLTRAIIEQLPIHSGYVPVSGRDADRVLEVAIADVRGRSMVGPGAGFPVREGALDFTVEARLRDASSGAVLRELQVVDRAEFRLPVGESEVSAIDEAVHDLARKIVLALEDDF